jgi:SAM-dependent methyltransferase
VPDLGDLGPEYADRDPLDPGYRWHAGSAVSVAYRSRHERALAGVLRDLGLDLRRLTVLDVGCGNGRDLRWLVELGLDPARAVGVDVLGDRLVAGRRMNPAVALVMGAAPQLPLRPRSVDLVLQATAFSSMPRRLRPTAAGEIGAVLRPGGHLLWLDTTREQPGRYPDGITEAGVATLFPGWEVVARRTLHSRPAARLSRSPLAAEVAELLPLWRTNVLLALRHPN